MAVPSRMHATTVRDHWWWRPGWRQGRQFFTWHLTFAGQDALHDVARTYQAALRDVPGLDPVPIEWLHLTVQGVAFADEIGAGTLREVTDAVAARLATLRAPDVTLQPPVVLHEGVALLAEPADQLGGIRSAIRAGLSSARGARNLHDAPEQARGFWPHVSLAYVNSPGPARPIVDAIQAVPPRPATITVPEAALIRLDRDERIYRWTTVAAAPFGAA